jgi:hypothetical protein
MMRLNKVIFTKILPNPWSSYASTSSPPSSAVSSSDILVVVGEVKVSLLSILIAPFSPYSKSNTHPSPRSPY